MGHSLEFENSVCVSPAESVCMNSCILMGRVEGLVGWFVVRVWVKGRAGGALHVWMRCCMMKFTLFLHVAFQEFKGFPSNMTAGVLGGAPLPIHVRPELREGTKWSRRDTLCKVRQVAVRKDACRDVGLWLRKPQPEDFPQTGN